MTGKAASIEPTNGSAGYRSPPPKKSRYSKFVVSAFTIKCLRCKQLQRAAMSPKTVSL